jgi:hypothetical protein
MRYPFKSSLKWKDFMENPNWFLDPVDFTGPDAHPYPVELEPPRGWGPPKVKRGHAVSDIDKERDENRLRCTFCRRTYGGVNAKSMWRRHVLDKHHVAMRNRRENGERPVGRTSQLPSLSDVASQSTNWYIAEENKKPPTTAKKPLPASSQSVKERIFQAYAMHTDGVLNESKLNIPQESSDLTRLPLTPKLANPSLDPFPSMGTMVRFSPYDPSRTPQFCTSLPEEPISFALKYPTLASPLYGPSLSPSKLGTYSEIVTTEHRINSSSPIIMASPEVDCRTSPKPDSFFLPDDRDDNMMSLDISYEDFNTSLSSQAVGSASLLPLMAADLSFDEEHSFAAFFNLEMDAAHSLDPELAALGAC